MWKQPNNNLILGSLCIILLFPAFIKGQQSDFNNPTKPVITTSFILRNTSATSGFPVISLSLRDVIERVGAENLAIKESEARYQLALAQENRARAWFLPSVFVGITNYAASGTVMNARGEFFQGVNPNNMTLQTGFAGEWKIADGIFLTKAAELRSLAASEDIQSQRLRAVLAAIVTYFDLTSAQERRRLLGETLTLHERLYQQMVLQQGAGLVYKSDVLLVQASLNRMKLLIQQANAEIVRRSAELSAIINLPRAHHIIAPDSIVIPVQLNNVELPDSVIRQAIPIRSELKSLQLEQEALQKELSALTTGRLIPSITANLSSNLVGAAFQPQYGRIAALVGLSWVLPMSDVVGKGQIQQTQSILELRQTQEKFLAIQLYRELTSLAGAIEALRPALTFAREEISASFEALRQSIERQKLGTAKPLEVLQTYEYVIRAQNDYVVIVSEYNKAEYQLFFSRGMTNNR